MTARFSTVARRDVAVALAFYEDCQRGFSGSFIDDLELALVYLSHFPLSGRGIGRSLRILVVGTFQHSLVYEPQSEGIFVLAVTDEEHSAEYWLRRAGI